MSELLPRGEALRKAVRFVSQKRVDDPSGSLSVWIDEATIRFDLNPAQSEWLGRFLRDASTSGAADDG